MGNSSDTSQAAAVSALIHRRAGIKPRPGLTVRRGDLGAGASIKVGLGWWTLADLDQTADLIEAALKASGYTYERDDTNRVSIHHIHFDKVKKPAATRKTTRRTAKDPIYAKGSHSVVVVDGRDCLDGQVGEEGRRVFWEIPRMEGQSEGDALRALARRLVDVAAIRDRTSARTNGQAVA